MRIRKIELYVGPFVDTKNTDTTSALKLLSTGDSDELAIRFAVIKTIDSTLNKAEVSIDNLNYETQTKFNQENLAIELRCGWLSEAPTADNPNPSSETGILTIHKGGLKIINSDKLTTRITSADGAGAAQLAITNRSYSGKDELEKVVRDLVGDMVNVQIGKLSLTGKLGFKGRQFSGRTTDHLNALAHQFGFTWSIQDGVFQAFMDDGDTEKVYTFTDNTIEDIRPVKGADGLGEGFAMRSYLDPRVNAGDVIQVDSKSRPQYSGRYVVTKHTMNGSSHENDWASVFEMVR